MCEKQNRSPNAAATQEGKGINMHVCAEELYSMEETGYSVTLGDPESQDRNCRRVPGDYVISFNLIIFILQQTGSAVSFMYIYHTVSKKSFRGSGKCYVYLVSAATPSEIFFSPGKRVKAKGYSHSSPKEHD